MTKRVCAKPGCPALIDVGTYRGLCDLHKREQARARGTRTEQGYGTDHQHARAAIQKRIDAGEHVHCWRCGVRLQGRYWNLDHTDDRASYRGPACIPCNTLLGGQASGRARGGGMGRDASAVRRS